MTYRPWQLMVSLQRILFVMDCILIVNILLWNLSWSCWCVQSKALRPFHCRNMKPWPSFLSTAQPRLEKVHEEGDQENYDEDEKNPYLLKATSKHTICCLFYILFHGIFSILLNGVICSKIKKRDYTHKVSGRVTIIRHRSIYWLVSKDGSDSQIKFSF